MTEGNGQSSSAASSSTSSNRITVVTTSFNKLQYLSELKEAMAGQTIRKDWLTWWVMDNSTLPDVRELISTWKDDWIKVSFHEFTPEERTERFIHPVLMNQAIAELDGSGLYIHISDDDLPHPEMLRVLVGFMRFNEDKDACYCPARFITEQPDGRWQTEVAAIPNSAVIFSENVDPMMQLDGNTVCLRVELLKRLWPIWPEGWERANVCDAEAMRKVCTVTRIWPATTDPLLVKRGTPLSTFAQDTGYRYGWRDHPLCEDIDFQAHRDKIVQEVTHGRSEEK